MLHFVLFAYNLNRQRLIIIYEIIKKKPSYAKTNILSTFRCFFYWTHKKKIEYGLLFNTIIQLIYCFNNNKKRLFYFNIMICQFCKSNKVIENVYKYQKKWFCTFLPHRTNNNLKKYANSCSVVYFSLYLNVHRMVVD